MMSLNKAQIIGNVGKKPEIRTMQDGSEMASFSVATSESWYDKVTNEKKGRTEWHKIVVFQKGLVEVVKLYVGQGSKLYLEGTLKTRNWKDQSGVERHTTEIVLQTYSHQLMVLENKAKTDIRQEKTEGGAEVYDLPNEESVSKPLAKSEKS